MTNATGRRERAEWAQEISNWSEMYDTLNVKNEKLRDALKELMEAESESLALHSTRKKDFATDQKWLERCSVARGRVYHALFVAGELLEEGGK